MAVSEPAPGAPAAVPHEERPARFMVIVAHPDDADFGVAGTAARWIDAGSVGALVCLTSGDAGGDDAGVDPLELARTREEEQRWAAAIVGYVEVTFLHQPDGALANDLAVREQLVQRIRAFRPDAVMTNDPTVLFHEDGYVNHADHRAAGMAAVDAVYPAARNPMAFPHLVRAGLAPHRVEALYLFGTDRPGAWVDITATLERKTEALRRHRSQFADPDDLVRRVQEWAEEDGAAIGVPAAEAFRLVRPG